MLVLKQRKESRDAFPIIAIRYFFEYLQYFTRIDTSFPRAAKER